MGEQRNWKDHLKKILWSFKENRRAQLIVMVVVVVILLGALISSLFWSKRTPAPVNTNTNTDIVTLVINTNTATAPTLPRVIDGVSVALGKENIFPTCVMIENLSITRPQAGLQSANVVYEALAEGGITRFMAVYASGDQLEKIGPVRSARPYYVDWAEEYHCLYAHAGGSPQALQQLYNTTAVVDLNQIGGAAANFWRDPDITPREHGLFTSSELLLFGARDRDRADAFGEYDGWTFKKESKKKIRPTEEKRISLQFSSSSYAVDYLYDAEHNWYNRMNGGDPHVDELTGEQIHVRNVVVQFVDTSLLEASSGRLRMETTGSGDAILFRDGQTVKGEWKKETGEERTRFFDDTGQEMQFIPGNIWIEVIPTDRSVEYSS